MMRLGERLARFVPPPPLPEAMGSPAGLLPEAIGTCTVHEACGRVNNDVRAVATWLASARVRL